MGQFIENAAVRAARAHHGRAHRDVAHRFGCLGSRQAEGRGNACLRKFANRREERLPDDRKTHGAAMIFNHGVQFFNDVELFYLCGKVADERFGEWVRHADFQDADVIPENLFDILIAGAFGDDADLL